MKKILLINPGFELEAKRKRYQLVFPFGLGYIATFCEKKGHQVEILDILGEDIGFKEVLKKINNYDFSLFDFIGITGIINQYVYIRELTKVLREKTKLPIVLGGPLSSYSWKIVLQTINVDVCVIGEGEDNLIEILEGKDLNKIDGIAFKEEDKIIKNKERKQIKNIDEIGSPAFHHFNMELYINNSEMQDVIKPFYREKRTMSMITARGCPYNCNFCSKSMEGNRKKSLDFIFSEIEYYKNVLKIESIHFVDELLLLNKKRFLDFCKRIKKYNIIWDCQGRINLVDEEILDAMKNSNGVLIGFGIESGSQKILNNMNKRIKRENIIKTMKYCVKINLPVKIQLIFGYPGESKFTLRETISLFKEIRVPGRRLSVITPLPGAPLYEDAKRDGFIGQKENDRITEKEYIELLSKTKGNVNEEIFYNRTEFLDDEFYLMKKKIENILFFNFIQAIILHPIYFLKHWFIFRMYLRDWWHHRHHLYFFNIRELFSKIIRHPNKWLKI